MRRVIPGLAWFARGGVVEGCGLLAGWLMALAAIALGVLRTPTGGWDGERGFALAFAVTLLVAMHLLTWHTRGTAHDSGPWARFRANRTAVAGLCGAGLLSMVMALAPLLAPFEPQAQIDLASNYLQPPSWAHPLGTDRVARDVASRLLYGARVSLTIGLVSAAIAVGVGCAVGAIAGYAGRSLDGLLMRASDMVLAFPRLVLLLVLMALVEHRSFLLVVLVLGLTSWMDTARLVRGEVLSLRQREFVLASRSLGLGPWRIITRHLLPNALAPALVSATLLVANVIQIEAGLSFLGLGVSPPTAAWGAMVADGVRYLVDAPWVAGFPGLAILVAVVSVQAVGDGLRDALDPRGRVSG